jgi:hypothetical protein
MLRQHETGGSPGWHVPGFDDAVMPSGCCQYRDSVLNLTFSGGLVGTSVIVFSRAGDFVWGKETLTTAQGTFANSIQGTVITGYGLSDSSLATGRTERRSRQRLTLNVVHGEIRTP